MSALVFMCFDKKDETLMPIFSFDTNQSRLKTEDWIDPDEIVENLVKLPDDIKNSERAKMCKLTGKQRQEMFASMIKLLVTIMKVVSFNIIVASIIPADKFQLDRGFRRQLPYFVGKNKVDDVFKVWDILIETNNSTWPTIMNANFPLEWYNGDQMSAFDKKTARDGIHFRVGPARLFQFRQNCDNFDESWKVKVNGTVEDWRSVSPLARPWLHHKSAKVPLDWYARIDKPIGMDLKIDYFKARAQGLCFV